MAGDWRNPLSRCRYELSQCGHGSSAGHSNGPPTELSLTEGDPGRGCNRIAGRAKEASSGKTAVTSTGRGGVVRTKTMPMILPPATDSPRPPAIGVVGVGAQLVKSNARRLGHGESKPARVTPIVLRLSHTNTAAGIPCGGAPPRSHFGPGRQVPVPTAYHRPFSSTRRGYWAVRDLSRAGSGRVGNPPRTCRGRADGGPRQVGGPHVNPQLGGEAEERRQLGLVVCDLSLITWAAITRMARRFTRGRRLSAAIV
jgi:hypothetical protein